MHSKKIMVLFGVLMMCFFLSACGNERTTKLINEIELSLDHIETLTISYDDEDISFFESGSNKLIVKEYMSKDKKSYYAKVRQKDTSIHISEGRKPVLKSGFTRYIEVYLPEDYSEKLEVDVTDGNIDMSDVELEMKSVRIDCTSGEVKSGKITAEDIYLSSASGELELANLIGTRIFIETTQGNVACGKVKGDVVYTSTSGDAEFMSASGSGTYKAENSGKLSVVYKEVTGDLSLYNKNDNVNLTLPQYLSFEFEANTKNGSIKTDFQDELLVKEKSASGQVGNHPEVTVKAGTKNGNIEVKR